MQTKHLCVLIHIRIKDEAGTVKLVLAVPRRYLFCGSSLFCVCLCHIVVSVSCSLVVTCWEMADFLAFLFVMFS